MTLTRGAGRQEQENGILAWLVVTLPDLAQNVLVKTPSVVAERFERFVLLFASSIHRDLMVHIAYTSSSGNPGTLQG
jgi:hypothetical protein